MFFCILWVKIRYTLTVVDDSKMISFTVNSEMFSRALFFTNFREVPEYIALAKWQKSLCHLLM